jgi:long-chain acyl-CoA synthetase
MSDDKTIVDIFLDNVKKFGDRNFMTQPMGGGNSNIKAYSFNETLDEAKKMASYIQSVGLPEKSQIAILSKNCAWWIIADLAIMMTGNVSVPIFPSLTGETTRYTLEHCEAKMLFIGKLDVKPWEEQKKGIPEGLPSVRFPLCPEDHGATEEKSWDEIISSSSPIAEPIKRTLDEMATIIYTSGSTGKPKGVMTSFKAMTLTTRDLTSQLKITDKDRWLSYLPVAHGMERWCGEMVPMYTANRLYFAESLKTFVDDLGRARPTNFLSVPRLYTKFQAGVFTKMPAKKLDNLLKIPLINILVKKKNSERIGIRQGEVCWDGIGTNAARSS